MILATRTVIIRRPLAVVAAQFADVAHHQRTGVHRGVRFTVLDETATRCHYDQVTSRGPLRLRQRFRLDRSDPVHQVNTVIAGSFRGDTLEFHLRTTEPDCTEATAILTSSRKRMRVAGPLLRPFLGRALQQALEEDKHDLEAGRYNRSEPPDAARNETPMPHA